MFVFPYSYPFESLPPVVVGRWFIDNVILYFSHQHKHAVVDVTLLISAHQGTSSSGGYKRKVARKDFYWNYKYLYNKTPSSYGHLTSNYLVIYIILFNIATILYTDTIEVFRSSDIIDKKDPNCFLSVILSIVPYSENIQSN